MNYEKVEHIGSHILPCRGMYEFLQKYARAGISLCLEGKEAPPGQIAATCLREGVSYMMDFIPGESEGDLITKIDFTKIEPEDVSSRDTEQPHPKVSILHCS